MSEPFLAELRMVGFNFAPRGWAFCDGQILPINQYQSLYSLLGTIYGGNGRTDFALPDLRGRTPIRNDNTYPLGHKSGEENHILTEQEMATHTHTMQASGASANAGGPSGALLAKTTLAAGKLYSTTTETSDTKLGASAITTAGLGQGHNNMQPYLVLNFCIALQGLFPSRN